MLKGEPAPWEAGSQRSSLTMQLGRKYHLATNDLARCKEQLDVLVVERRRLVVSLEAVLAAIEATIAQMSEVSMEVVSLEAAPLLSVEQGKLFWLEQHAQHVRAQREEVVSLDKY